MDDSRTEETLDALADLFLTGTGSDPSAMPRATGTDVADQLQGPAPIRLGPKRVAPRPPQREPQEEGPRLRLHRPDSDADPSAPVSAATSTTDYEVDASPVEAVVEATLLGNLPGFGGPWLTQYAQLLADEHGPVVVLHVDAQRIDAELVQPAGSTTLSGFEFSAGENQPAAVVDMLNVLLRLQPTPVRMVLVNAGLGERTEVTARLTTMKLWTLLTGGDDMAVAAAGQLLRQQLDASKGAAAPPQIGLVVMGSDEHAAHAAVERIRNLTADVIQPAAALVGHLRQMGPVNVRQLGSFEQTAESWTALTALFDQIMPQLPATASPAESVPTRTPPAGPTVPPAAKVKPRIADAVRPPGLKPRPARETETQAATWSPLESDAPRMKPRVKTMPPPAVAAATSRART